MDILTVVFALLVFGCTGRRWQSLHKSRQHDQVPAGQSHDRSVDVPDCLQLKESPASLGLAVLLLTFSPFARHSSALGRPTRVRQRVLPLNMGKLRRLVNHRECAGCGSQFQCDDPSVPGFIPEDKLFQKDLESQELVDSIKVKVELTEELIDKMEVAEEELVEEQGEKDITFCQRCFRLRNYGKIDDVLRPGWSRENSLMPAHFQKLIEELRYKNCIIITMVDVFDFHGSMLPDIAEIAGGNPVIVAVNKVDLLPWQDDLATTNSVRAWIREESAAYGLKDLGGQNIHLVSAKTGKGVEDLFDTARRMALSRGCDVYIVGAANVGKSSLVNKLMNADGGQYSKGRKKSSKPMPAGITASNLPGTTLSFVKIQIGRGIKLIDTPGLILPHQLTVLLNPDELTQVIPHRPIKPTTQQYGEGQTLLLGGLGRIDILEGLPFSVTMYLSDGVKIHPSNYLKKDIDAFVRSHVGTVLTPPSDPDRLDELGPLETHEFRISGFGWDEAACDIVLSGLGWASFTGVGDMRIRVSVPKGVMVKERKALMPREASVTVTKKFSGGTLARVGTKKLQRNRHKRTVRR